MSLNSDLGLFLKMPLSDLIATTKEVAKIADGGRRKRV